VCGTSGRFLAFGLPPRLDARCRRCGSLERQRLLALYLQRTNSISGRDVLHFAPEPGLAQWLCRSEPRKYISGDLRKSADRILDVEQLEIEDASFDVVICSHVLEHVDDRKALEEIARVLRPGGLAILMVPIIEAWNQTYEDAAVSTPQARRRHFGQEDHVRYYGRDFRDRVSAAGFSIAEFTATEPDVQRFGLLRGETVFACRKA
jgi:SAM-dependent methyltransferase